jgi:AcrR family transcriptional regulator
VARQTAIVEAATGIFLRYGFRKTSMDDVARAVGISRQSLYLYFQSKEALFGAVVAHSVQALRAEAKISLVREDLDLEERMLGAFAAMHGKSVGAEHLGELIATTAALVGPVFREAEEALVVDIALTLRAAGIAERWEKAGVSANELAEHLSKASNGIKHSAQTLAEYLDRMRIAVRIVCRGASG